MTLQSVTLPPVPSWSIQPARVPFAVRYACSVRCTWQLAAPPQGVPPEDVAAAAGGDPDPWLLTQQLELCAALAVYERDRIAELSR